MLPDLTQIDVLNIIVKQVRRFLSDFSRTYPEDEEIRKSIEAFNNITSLQMLSKQGQLIAPLFDKYWDSPGVSNFRNVFKGITKPQQYFEHSGEFVDTVVSIFAGILVAIETNNYWGDNPEYSKTFFGPDIRRAIFMGVEQASDPKNKEMHRSLLTELTRDFEIALQSG